MYPILIIFFFLYCLVCIDCSPSENEKEGTYINRKAYKK